jgi:hypothetical protein
MPKDYVILHASPLALNDFSLFESKGTIRKGIRRFTLTLFKKNYF